MVSFPKFLLTDRYWLRGIRHWLSLDGYKLHVLDEFSSGRAQRDPVNIETVVVDEGGITSRKPLFKLT
ncbi:MAG: hypothetical protein VXX40_01205 [Candidatus Thermoplasmatota archaeon]|nr:hypothetical protein [Candidatus Thermoplasmatota archaeon]